MKSKTHNYKMGNSRNTKNLKQILLGILALTFSNLAISNNTANSTNSLANDLFETDLSLIEKPVLNSEPCATLPCTENYKKSIEDTIKENNLIIESQIANEDYPLDFKKIYKAQTEQKKKTNQKGFAHKRILKM